MLQSRHFLRLLSLNFNGTRSNSGAVSVSQWRERNSVGNLKKRGILQEVFPPLEDSQLSELIHQSPAAYCGFDPTAESLHVGNLLPMILLLRLQAEGVKPVAVVGDATAKIGDPSGRVAERDPIEQSTIENNCKGLENNIRTVFSNFQNDQDLPELQIVRNSTWYENMNAADFADSIERFFRINKMLNRESVRQRLNSPGGMLVTEFCYQVFQGFDWLQLFQRHKCSLQIGGLDQLGNIEGGHDLIKRLAGANSHGLMTPLITTASGEKFGKSAGNAVWLSADKTSPKKFYEFFVKTSNEEAIKLTQLFSLCNDEELEEMIEVQEKFPDRLTCQRRLAKDVTVLVHGDEGLRLIEETQS